ncbi:asparagine synthase [Legionella steigerwaltii]|uniref:asparagine synthase (glutamine-hydrolyzing) n=1 Tax=Legionella steigerwaltii TaxID=460 RepID=A0A378L5H4_9GAMM|nr:asparagine synthase (glutamine-hydrolyzing) [Legionella steigerwaltii]KTD77119.1 asparagine synthase [Legionella steigerwaltii]STY21610.1 asparagine synthase [Legionella steigerwaltii]
MCGIAGIINFDRSLISKSMLKAMTDSIAHRGPDGEGFWFTEGVGLGHRRLAIRDLSDAGHQPMQDALNQISITYNGEIYNYDEIRSDLEKETNYLFKSSCDAELLPIGWLTWGEKLFDRIEGMFAIGIWDHRTETLILVRDGIGIKPLFYAQNNASLFFCSEIKGILATKQFPMDIDEGEFHTYLASGYTNPEHSLIKNIKQLEPGTILKVSFDGLHSCRNYWQPVRKADQSIQLDDAVDELEILLSQVINQMLVADVPIGLLQSSGIDSSLIALLTQSEVISYTAQFNEASHDESILAQKIANFTKHPWRAVSVDQASHMINDFYLVSHHVDGQLADSSCFAHFALSREASNHVTVAIAGDGADEIFAGYSTYKASRIAHYTRPIIPKFVAKHLGDWLFKKYGHDERRIPWHEMLMRFLWGVSISEVPHSQWRRLAYPFLLSKLYSPTMYDFLNENPLANYEKVVVDAPGAIFDKCLLADQRIYLPGDMLTKVDRMSMAHGLEIRVPFLDRRIINFASKLPEHLLSPLFGKSKLTLRKILSKHSLLNEVVKGKKKGFNIPLASLLRNQLNPVGEEIIMKNADIFAPFINPDKLREVWREHNDREFNHAYSLWALLIFGSWRMKHI